MDGRIVEVAYYPFATQHGKIVVPNEFKTQTEVETYIQDHFTDIEFAKPELDYAGTDFEYYDEED